jgi:hypothetical protein
MDSCEVERVDLPEGFHTAMPNLQRISITSEWQRPGKVLHFVFDGRAQPWDGW